MNSFYLSLMTSQYSSLIKQRVVIQEHLKELGLQAQAEYLLNPEQSLEETLKKQKIQERMYLQRLEQNNKWLEKLTEVNRPEEKPQWQSYMDDLEALLPRIKKSLGIE